MTGNGWLGCVIGVLIVDELSHLSMLALKVVVTKDFYLDEVNVKEMRVCSFILTNNVKIFLNVIEKSGVECRGLCNKWSGSSCVRGMTLPGNRKLLCVGSYRLTGRRLGKGNFAKVEEAVHTVLKTKVTCQFRAIYPGRINYGINYATASNIATDTSSLAGLRAARAEIPERNRFTNWLKWNENFFPRKKPISAPAVFVELFLGMQELFVRNCVLFFTEWPGETLTDCGPRWKSRGMEEAKRGRFVKT